MEHKEYEDYLRALYKLQREKNRAIHSIELARYLKLKKGTVSEMLKKLAREELVDYRPYQPISLTKKGIKKAEMITFKHCILEIFLKKILNLKKKEIHEEADKIEHSISEKAIDKMKTLLDKPSQCPHGKPLPEKDKSSVLLIDMDEGQTGKILFTKIHNKDLLERINSMGFVPYTPIKVLNKIKKGPMEIELKRCKVALSSEICNQIYIKT